MVAFNEVKTNNKVSIDFPHQFDIVFVDLPEVVGAKHMQKGYHPAVVLSSNSNNKNNSNITVIPISSRINKARHLSTHLYLNLEAVKSLGLYKESVIQAENTMPVDKSMIKKIVGHVANPEMKESIKRIVNAYIGFLYTAWKHFIHMI